MWTDPRTALRTANDIFRTMDFVEQHGTRFGLDPSKVALCSCYGSSLYSPCWLVGDELVTGRRRFQAVIFPNGGLINCVQAPECDQLTFLPHLKVPTLLYTSKAKYDIPYEYSQLNFFNLIPLTAPKEKFHFSDNHVWGLSLTTLHAKWTSGWTRKWVCRRRLPWRTTSRLGRTENFSGQFKTQSSRHTAVCRNKKSGTFSTSGRHGRASLLRLETASKHVTALAYFRPHALDRTR